MEGIFQSCGADTYIDDCTIVTQHLKQRNQDCKFNILIFTDVTVEPKLVTLFMNLFNNIR